MGLENFLQDEELRAVVKVDAFINRHFVRGRCDRACASVWDDDAIAYFGGLHGFFILADPPSPIKSLQALLPFGIHLMPSYGLLRSLTASQPVPAVVISGAICR